MEKTKDGKGEEEKQEVNAHTYNPQLEASNNSFVFFTSKV